MPEDGSNVRVIDAVVGGDVVTRVAAGGTSADLVEVSLVRCAWAF